MNLHLNYLDKVTIKKDQSFISLGKLILNGVPKKMAETLQNNEMYPEIGSLWYLFWLSESYTYNLFPDGGGAGSFEITARWNGQERLQFIHHQLNTISPKIGTTTRSVEEKFFFEILPTLQNQKAFLQNAGTNSMAIQQQLLKISENNINSFRTELDQLDEDIAYQQFLQTAWIDLLFRSGERSQAIQKSWDLVNQYWSNQQADLAAIALLQLSDFLSASYSSPLVWNLAIQENMGATNDLNWLVEEKEMLFVEKELKSAKEYLGKAQTIYQQKGDQKGIAHCFLREVYFHVIEEDYNTALEKAKIALNLFLKEEDFFHANLCKTQLVLLKIGQGNLLLQETELQEIADWGNEVGSFSYTLGLGFFMVRMGRHWILRKGDIEKSLTAFQSANFLFTALDARTNVAQTHFDLGKSYELIGAKADSLNAYEKGLDVFETIIRDPQSKINGDVYRIYLMAANELLQYYNRNKDGDGIQRIESRLNKILGINQNQLTFQHENVVMDTMVNRLIQHTLGQAKILGPIYLALVERDRGNSSKANHFFNQAAEQLKGQNNYLMEGVLYGHLKQYDRAKKSFYQYLNQGSGFAASLTALFQNAGEERFQSELTKQDQRSLELALTFMVRVKAYEDALIHANKLTQQFGENWWTTQERLWESLTDLGEMYEGVGDFNAAQKHYNLAINALEDRRSSLSRDDLKSAIGSGIGIQYLYFYAARTAMKQNQPERALQYLELNKARALQEMIAENVFLGKNVEVVDNKKMAEWKGLSARVALLKSLISQEHKKVKADKNRIVYLQKELTKIQANLNQLTPTLSNIKIKELSTDYRKTNISISSISQNIPDKALLIEYFLLDSELLIWAIDREGLKVATCITDLEVKAINRQINAFHASCANIAPDWKKRAKELSNIFIEPLREYLNKYQQLLFIPYATLHKLPFAALIWKEKPLIQQFQISYLPTATLTSFLKKKNQCPEEPSILSVGNPKNMAFQEAYSLDKGRTLDSLYFAKNEAEYVANLFPNSTLLVDEKATESAVVEAIPNHNILHFATHGTLSEYAPLNSAILFANGEALTVYELMGLQLKAELVVLSACQTALGEITGGDDILGLTRGILAAGGQSALVSLWEVNDLTTGILVGKFFESYKNGTTSTASLQLAQHFLSGLKKEEGAAIFQQRGGRAVVSRVKPKEASKYYDHPYYWAAFVFIGM